MGLEWKPIVDFPGYWISNTGLVKSKKQILKPILHKVDAKTKRFYVSLYKNGKPKIMSVARLVAIAFIPNPENKPNVDHIDRNVLNNCVENLRWVNQSENLLNENTVKYRSMMIGNQKARDVAIKNGIPRETFYRRIRNGWDVESASSLPVCKESNELMNNKRN